MTMIEAHRQADFKALLTSGLLIIHWLQGVTWLEPNARERRVNSFEYIPKLPKLDPGSKLK